LKIQDLQHSILHNTAHRVLFSSTGTLT